jgi:hypothetical protein
MKKPLLTALVLLALATPAFSAIQYDFIQKSSVEGATVPNTDLTGRAVIDGDRSRIDFIAGDVYPAGTYVVSTDGARNLYFVDPEKKWYTEFNTASIASSISASQIKISNLKSEVVKLGEGEIIAGIPTERHQLTLSYDITVTINRMPLRQGVKTTVRTWTTQKFGEVGRTAFSSQLRTGNPEVDQILELETTRVPGLPLRQIVTTITTNLSGRPVKSEIQLPATRTITREMWVTSIREVSSTPVSFTVPVSYRRADTPEVPKAPAQVLEFKPATK